MSLILSSNERNIFYFILFKQNIIIIYYYSIDWNTIDLKFVYTIFTI